jgi:hypothetical protein
MFADRPSGERGLPSSSQNSPAVPARWCVIGAGPSGLTALKNLHACGIEAECLEREAEIGGNWCFGSPASCVLESTRLISSQRLTEYTDFPMPREWPAYPDHRRCLEYLRGYAAHFGLLDAIRVNTSVERIEPGPHGGWSVEVSGSAPTVYAGVLLATGHNREPRWPEIARSFTGILLHARDYKSPTAPVPIAGRRVLVIGGGNSGCDIAVEASFHASCLVHSTRRRYHVIPRDVLGRPSDLRAERLLSMKAPLWLRRLVSRRAIARTIGLPRAHGLPEPDHRLWESHPVINDRLYARISAGGIRPAGDVVAFEDQEAIFQDGSREAFDIVICATGYRTTFPGITPADLHATDDAIDLEPLPRLYLHCLHPHRSDIAVIGLIQPDSGQWGLTDLQSQVVARMILADRHSPAAAAWLARERQRPWPAGTIHYLDSPRHRLEVEHFSYRHALQRLIRGLDRRLRRAAHPTSPR